MQNEFKIYKICSFIVYGISHRLCFILQFVIDFSRQKIYILLANIIARIISAACNYMANCLFVFKEKQRLWSALSYFLLAVFILFMNNIVLLIYSGIPGLSLYIVKILTELTLFITSYLIQKKFIFKKKF